MNKKFKVPKKYLFLTSNHTWGHINECISVAKKISKFDKDSEIIFVCDGDAAALAEHEGFCVIKLPLNGAFSDKYRYGSKTDFEPFVDPLLDSIVKTINPDMVIMNFRYAFDACNKKKIPYILIFPNELDDRLKFYSELASKIFFIYPKKIFNNKNLNKIDTIGPIIADRVKTNVKITKDTYVMTLGGGGWKDHLKKIIKKVAKYFDSQGRDKLLIMTNDFSKKDFDLKSDNVDFNRLLNTEGEFIDLMAKSKGIIAHGGSVIFQASMLNKPTVSIPIPFLRDQIKRSNLLEKYGCVVKLNFNKINSETLGRAIEKSHQASYRINQKKYLKDTHAAEIIAKYAIKNSKKKNIVIDKGNFDVKFVSNNESDLCILSKVKSKSRIFFSWTESLSLDYQSPIPEWFRRIIPYQIQKEMNLHKRNSESTFSIKGGKAKGEDLIGHYSRVYEFDNKTIIRWHCKESGLSFLCLIENSNKREVKRIRCH